MAELPQAHQYETGGPPLPIVGRRAIPVFIKGDDDTTMAFSSESTTKPPPKPVSIDAETGFGIASAMGEGIDEQQVC